MYKRQQIQESIRGCDVFLIQPTCAPVNDHLMELLIMVDACRRASARQITAVVPYYGYARADRKTAGRESITAKLTANLLVTSGVDRVLAMDLHSAQIQGYFDIPCDHIYGLPCWWITSPPRIWEMWWWCLLTLGAWRGPGPSPSR